MTDFEEINNRLIGVYGDPSEEFACKLHSNPSCRNRADGSDEAVDVLVETVLSQNTTDKNSHCAFLNLKRRWPLWSQVMTCDEKDLAAEIRVGGLAAIKAGRIKKILAVLLEKTVASDPSKKGEAVVEPTLHFLDRMKNDEVMKALQDLPGVGPKTAACTMLFGLGRECIPVDTHVFRISTKLGATRGTTPEAVQAELEDLIPPHVKLPLHLLFLEHGRHVCTARKAMCNSCVIADLCATGRKTVRRRKTPVKEEKDAPTEVKEVDVEEKECKAVSATVKQEPPCKKIKIEEK